jgi:hypothetical protein
VSRAGRPVLALSQILALCYLLWFLFLPAYRVVELKETFWYLLGIPHSSGPHYSADYIESMTPMVYDAETGAVIARYDPYCVLTDKVPRSSPPRTMRTMIQVKRQHFTLFNRPWNYPFITD